MTKGKQAREADEDEQEQARQFNNVIPRRLIYLIYWLCVTNLIQFRRCIRFPGNVSLVQKKIFS